MAEIYRHRQGGTPSIIALGAFAALAVGLGTSIPMERPERMVVSILIVTILLVLVLFSSLTVTVSHEHVDVRFGPGLVRKRFRSTEVLQAKPVRNHWYYGWGIRLTPHGWLFNVSGLDAVELLMRDGKTYRIGTNQPKELAAAISRARKGR